jgi:uncharacterized repeat protein (TIGR03837 family)
MQWDVFCRVIDNWGDVGVCWRLSAALAQRGEHVRLWIDDPEPLDWMAPGAREGRWPGVQIRPWCEAMPPTTEESWADVWVEAFACEPPATLVGHRREAVETGTRAPPVWINLEYLSAEDWVQRCHALPSPLQHGPGRGLTRWFFHPGFKPGTGGLLREPDLMARQAAFDRRDWRRARGLPQYSPLGSLFCYEPPALGALLSHVGPGRALDHLLVAPGRAAQAVHAFRTAVTEENPETNPPTHDRLHELPSVPQTEFDGMLWACDLNFVRGEDSLIRALWAGQALVWQIYPQHDDVHHGKLEAFLDWLQAPPDLRHWHRVWNGMEPATLPAPDWPAWRDCVRAARERLLAQDDLVTQLCRFVLEKH